MPGQATVFRRTITDSELVPRKNAHCPKIIDSKRVPRNCFPGALFYCFRSGSLDIASIFRFRTLLEYFEGSARVVSEETVLLGQATVFRRTITESVTFK